MAIALSIRACLAGQRVQFATATEWVARLTEAKRQDNLETELRRLSFIPLLVIDEVGYIPFDPEAASLMFSLVSNRYERASMIVTSNKPFSKWGDIFGDDMAATAMIDRLIHHSEILSPQRRQLPPARQRARRPPSRETPRNRLTDPPRPPRRGPQNASQRADPTAGARQTGLKRPSPPRPRPTGSASRRRSLSLSSTLTGSVLNRRGGPLFNRREWSTFQPALTDCRKLARSRRNAGVDRDSEDCLTPTRVTPVA